jgi:hypothetical protein
MQTQQSRPAVETVHRLLFQALLEMRSEGHEHKNKLVYHLADLFHCVVLEMESAAAGKTSYDDVLRILIDRARERGLERWLNQTSDRLSNGAPGSE